jgi:hypothetical protein
VSNRVDVGGVIRRTFQIYSEQVSVLVPAAAVVFVLSSILTALLIAASPGLAIVAIVVAIVAQTLFTGMVVELVADVQDGRRDATAGQLVKAVTPVLGQLLLVAVVAGIGIAIGFILIIVPGLILLTIWSVAAPVVVLERPGGLRALGRSRELVRGDGWNVFAVILLMVILVALVSGAIEAVAGSGGAALGLIVQVIVGILAAPISALATAVLYFELGGAAKGGLPGGGHPSVGDHPSAGDHQSTGDSPSADDHPSAGDYPSAAAPTGTGSPDPGGSPPAGA